MITCWHCSATLLNGTIFCDACGAALLEGAARRLAPPFADAGPPDPARPPTSEPRLVLAASGASIPLPATPQLVVGRAGEQGPGPDIDLTPFQAAAAGVSRAHARLDLGGPHPRIEDLDSTNGTYVNGRRLAPRSPVRLHCGDEISLGQLALRLEL